MKQKATLIFLMLITNALMILGTQVQERLSNENKKPVKGAEKDETPDFLFFASKLYL